MVRKLALILALAAAAIPLQVSALGLGDVELKSHLNQRLSAEIEILTIDKSELKGLKVRLASASEFRRAGLEYSPKLKDISFRVVRKRGKTYIKVSSSKPFKEPYLSILVEVSWNRGRIFREYALLIDPPVTVPSQGTQFAVKSEPEAAQSDEEKPVEEPKEEPKQDSPQEFTATLRTPDKKESKKESKKTSPSKVDDDFLAVKEEIIKDKKPKKAQPSDIPPEEDFKRGDRDYPTIANKEFEKEENRYPRVPLSDETDRSAEVSLSKTDTRRGAKPGSVYKVRRGDTMFAIAKRVRPQGATIYQTMMAIKKANPRAFLKNNVHWVRAGHKLVIPDRLTIQSFSVASARRQYRADTDVFRDRVQKQGRVTIAKTAVKSRTARTKGVFDVVAPNQTDKDLAGKLGESSNKNGKSDGVVSGDDADIKKAEAAIEKDLKADKQVLINKAREELLKTIDETNRTKGLFSVKSSAGKAVQDALKIAEYCKQNPTDSKCREVTGYQPPDIDAIAAKHKNKTVKPFTKEGERSKPVSAGFLDTAKMKIEGWVAYFKSNPMIAAVAGGGVLFVIILLFLIVRQRRRVQDEFQESILDFEEASTAPMEAPQPSSFSQQDAASVMPQPAPVQENKPAAATPGVETSLVGDGVDDGDASSYLSDFVVSNMDTPGADAAESDPITEADVFYAYGKYEAAEMLIKEAIQNEPNRLDLRYKLLDIYHGAKNKDSFEYEASILYDMLNGASDPMWNKVVEMGRELAPDNALFGGATDADSASDPTAVATGGEAPTAVADSAAEATVAVSTDTGTPASLDSDLDLEFDFNDLNAGSDDQSASSPESLTNDLEAELAELEKAMAGEAAQAEADAAGSDFSENVVSFDAGDSSNELLASTENDLDPYESDTGLMSDIDEVGTKLDLAKAYIDMGDPEGARSILDEVLEEGNDEQKGEAEELMQQMVG